MTLLVNRSVYPYGAYVQVRKMLSNQQVFGNGNLNYTDDKVDA